MNEDYIVGSGNVFKDLGFENAEDELAKVELASIINEIIDDRGLSQRNAGKILDLDQTKVLALRDGRLKGFSIELLFSFLDKLDQHVEIKITHKSKSKIKSKRRVEVSFLH